MTNNLIVERAGPAVSIQDAGRAGGLGLGVSRGGAVDQQAYLEGCALLGHPSGTAVLEMAGLGGAFRVDAPTRIALTGAPMRATLDGAPLEWGAAHLMAPGALLQIEAAHSGVYGYLSLGGGITTEPELGGRGYHRIAGLGRAIVGGDRLPVGHDADIAASPMRLGRTAQSDVPIRVMPGPQSAFFARETHEQFVNTVFIRSPKANRQGVRLDYEGAPFSVVGQLNQVSDFIAEGDVQMTGDGTPYVLLADCQTMGGYPRIGTVLPCDLHRIAQAMLGDALRFEFVTLEEAEVLWQSDEARLTDIERAMQPRVRDPREMSDLLAYELISKPIDG